MNSGAIRRGLIAAAAIVASATAQAQPTSDFYLNRDLSFYIGFNTAGGYDVYARALGRHMNRHIPGNPAIIPRNVPGAGSIILANQLYQQLPKDGTAIGMLHRAVATEVLFGNTSALFDPSKFIWIGSPNSDVASVCVAWDKAGIDSLDQFLKSPVVVGATVPATSTFVFPSALNAILGAKFTIVTGYKGGHEINLAMERGEVQGRCGWSWSSLKTMSGDYLAKGHIKIMLQMSTAQHPDLTAMGVPFVMDLAKTERDRQILTVLFADQEMGQPIAAPPGVPDDRIKILRDAFDRTVRDPAFMADATALKLDLGPVDGRSLQQLVATIMATPSDVVAAAKAVASAKK